MSLSPAFIAEIRAALNTAAIRSAERGKPWRSRAFRYTVEDNFHVEAPSHSKAHLIPMSEAASAIVTEAHPEGRPTKHSSYVKLGLRYEHSVPLSVLWRVLMEERRDAEAIERLLLSLYQCAWVTLEQDKRLTRAGFHSKMPENWTPADGWKSRYDCVDITIFEVH